MITLSERKIVITLRLFMSSGRQFWRLLIIDVTKFDCKFNVSLVNLIVKNILTSLANKRVLTELWQINGVNHWWIIWLKRGLYPLKCTLQLSVKSFETTYDTFTGRVLKPIKDFYQTKKYPWKPNEINLVKSRHEKIRKTLVRKTQWWAPVL